MATASSADGFMHIPNCNAFLSDNIKVNIYSFTFNHRSFLKFLFSWTPIVASTARTHAPNRIVSAHSGEFLFEKVIFLLKYFLRCTVCKSNMAQIISGTEVAK